MNGLYVKGICSIGVDTTDDCDMGKTADESVDYKLRMKRYEN